MALCAVISPVTGEFSARRPVTRSFDVFFDLRLNKRLSKQSWGWWFETPSRSLWRHCNDYRKSYCKAINLVANPGANHSHDFMRHPDLIYQPNQRCIFLHYSDVIMGAKASQLTTLTIIYSIVYSGEDQRKHQSSASLAFVRGIHRWPVNSPHKWPVTRKMFPFDDVIMEFLRMKW